MCLTPHALICYVRVFIRLGWLRVNASTFKSLPHGLVSWSAYSLYRTRRRVAYGINTDSQPITIHPSNVTGVPWRNKKNDIFDGEKNKRQHFGWLTACALVKQAAWYRIRTTCMGRDIATRQAPRTCNRVDCEQFMRLSIRTFYSSSRTTDVVCAVSTYWRPQFFPVLSNIRFSENLWEFFLFPFWRYWSGIFSK